MAPPSPRPAPLGAHRVGRLFGIDIRVHFTFVLFLGWVLFSHLLRGEGWRAASSAVLLLCSVFAIVVCHELGHALVARRFGIRTRDILLLPIGGVGRLERIPSRPGQELAIAIAGPAVNLVFAALIFGVLTLQRVPEQTILGVDLVGSPLLVKLFWINVSLAIFNLIPAFPMDGGRVFRALLALRLDRVRATQIAAQVGRALAVGLALLGLAGNAILFLIALFVWFGAGAERAHVELQAATAGVPVERWMLTRFATLSQEDSLGVAAQQMRSSFQQVFPVLAAGRPVGTLSHAELLAGFAALGERARVADVMTRELRTIERSATLDQILEGGGAADGPVLVMDGPQLVGLILPEHLADFVVVPDRPDRPGATPPSAPTPLHV